MTSESAEKVAVQPAPAVAGRDVRTPLTTFAPVGFWPAGDLAESLTTDQVLALQRTAGNRAVTRLLSRAETKAEPSPYPGAPTVDQKPAPGTEVSTELSDAPGAATAAERVFKWLQVHAAEIAAQEQTLRVDRRAIAGAIAWEAIQNPRSWYEHAGGRFVGAGKAHVKKEKHLPAAIASDNVPQQVEEAGLQPKRSLSEREFAMYKNAIPYIGGGMRLASDIARGYGYEISQDPLMLTWFWQSKDANSFIEVLSKRDPSKPFDTSQTDMPNWVKENMTWLESAVGKCALKPLAPGEAPAKAGTMEIGSWRGSYSIDARLPETRQFLVNGGQVDVKIGVWSEHRKATGYAAWIVMHRRQDGSDVAIGEAKRVNVNEESTVSWTDLKDGLYFLEIFSLNGIKVEGDLDVTIKARGSAARAGSGAQNALQRRVLGREPDAGVPAAVTDAGGADAGSGAPTDAGTLRANAARTLVAQLRAKKVKYGHNTSGPGTPRTDDWWWDESEFDCSKFVLWVMADRKPGDAPAPEDKPKNKAIRDVRTEAFGGVADSSAVKSVVEIIGKRVQEGTTRPIDKSRAPQVGDLMFWTGHAAIVVELKPDPKGGTRLVWAHMGTSNAGLIEVKVDEIEKPRKPPLASGEFLGFWTP